MIDIKVGDIIVVDQDMVKSMIKSADYIRIMYYETLTRLRGLYKVSSIYGNYVMVEEYCSMLILRSCVITLQEQRLRKLKDINYADSL